MSSGPQQKIVAILVDIRSAFNVGSIFRTADAAGVSKIYLAGYTPTPIDRFGRARRDLAKVALGAEKTVPWEYVKSAATLVAALRKEDFKIIAVEQSENSVDYRTVSIIGPTAILFGSEVEGLSKELFQAADIICEIPMRGEKESLNVSVAFGIVLFQITGLPTTVPLKT
jgi:tRNA G18 (ribose-2'-O)-methylase SpoU